MGEEGDAGRRNHASITHDSEFQCDIFSSTALRDTQRNLAEARLELVAVKGQLADARRTEGLASDSEQKPSGSDCAASQTDSELASRRGLDEDGEEKQHFDSDAESSRDCTVEVGDVAHPNRWLDCRKRSGD